MRRIFRDPFAKSLALGLLCASVPAAQSAQAADAPFVVGGVEAACTGVGLEARSDGRWSSYPLKIVVAGRGGQFLGRASLSVAADRRDTLQLQCNGPWILLRLKPGKYRVTATAENETAASAAFVREGAAGRIVLRFPALGGAISREHKPATD